MPAEGLLLLDKPAGPTSHDLVAMARKRFWMREIGHAGTLDPFATGVLLVLVGAATRLSGLYLHGDKSYSGRIRFGVATDSGDSTGNVVAETSDFDPERIRLEVLRATIAARFLGEIRQRPPAFSAVHVAGKRSYELARKGTAVELEERTVRIDRFDLAGADGPFVDFACDVSSGTYIRQLAVDLGAAVGLPAHLVSLRRTRLGPFDVARCCSPDEMGPERLLSVEESVDFVARHEVSDPEGVFKLTKGNYRFLIPAMQAEGLHWVSVSDGRALIFESRGGLVGVKFQRLPRGATVKAKSS